MDKSLEKSRTLKRHPKLCEIDRFRQDVFDLWIDRGLKPISVLGIGVGPPRDPESRDTLGRILGIFA